MTYNFDPDLWRDNHLLALEERLGRGEIRPEDLPAAREAIEAAYERMVRGLDGTYQLPGGGGGPAPATG